MRSFKRSEPRLKAKIQYQFDNLMAKGGFTIFLSLMFLFFCGFLFMSASRILLNWFWPDETLPALTDYLWRVTVQMGLTGIHHDNLSHPLHKTVAILTVALGMVLFSSMVAFINAVFNEKIRSLRKGTSTVIEEGHTVILGFNEHVLEILQELIIANESEKKAVVVILSETDKELIDDTIHNNISDTKTTRIVVRHGNNSSITDLNKVSITHARSIIVTNYSLPSASEEERNEADFRIIKSLMAIVSIIGEVHMPPVVTHLHSPVNRRLAHNIAPDSITIIDASDVLSRVLAQTSLYTGLALVYSKLIGFENQEIYFFRPSHGWLRYPYGQLIFHFIRSSLIGFRTADGRIILNPPKDFIPENSYDGILIAEDDSDIRFYERPVILVDRPTFFIKKATLGIENQIIIGWSAKIPSLIQEYTKHLLEGSSITILAPIISEEMQAVFTTLQQAYPHIKFDFMKGNVLVPGMLDQLQPAHYDSVIILAADQAQSNDVDSQTISILLELRSYFRRLEHEHQTKVKTKLVTEIMNSEHVELLMEMEVKDYLVPFQFISKIIAQTSQEPDVLRVYYELFDARGCDIYVKSASLYFENLPILTSYAHCMKVAMMRGETCFGVMKAQTDSQDKEYGAHLSPYKNEIFNLTEADGIIVLSHYRS